MVAPDNRNLTPASRPQQDTLVNVAPKAGVEIAPTIEAASMLGEYLITTWVGSGGAPHIPAGHREEVVVTLSRCMVDEPVFKAYTDALKAGWNEHRSRAPMAGYPAGDIDAPTIIKNGFGALSSEALADIAVDPAAVIAVYKTLNMPPPTPEDFIQPGEWFASELQKVQATRPGA